MIAALHLKTVHDSRDRLRAQLSATYLIHDLVSKIDHVIKNCVACITRNRTTTVPTTKPILSREPFERIIADLFQMPVVDPTTSSRFCLVVVDHFTKFTWAFPLVGKDAGPIADAIVGVLQTSGAVSAGKTSDVMVHTDNGREFVNKVMSDVIENFSARRVTGAPYHPQSQGLVERKNQVFKQKIGKLLHKAAGDSAHAWSQHVAVITQNENNAVSATTKCRPHLLLFGHDHPSYQGGDKRLPPNVLRPDELQIMRGNAMVAMAEKASRTHARSLGSSTKFCVGSIVWVDLERQKTKRAKKTMLAKYGVKGVVVDIDKSGRYRLKWLSNPTHQKHGKINELSKRLFEARQMKLATRQPYHSAAQDSKTPHRSLQRHENTATFITAGNL